MRVTLAHNIPQISADHGHERALARRAKRRSRAPALPFNLVSDSPHWPSLNSAEAGALALLADAWWRGNGRELPTGDVNLSVIAKCHMNRWYGVKTRVLEAWGEVLPVLRYAYSQLSEAHGAKVAKAIAASDAAMRKRRSMRTNPQEGDKQTAETVSVLSDQDTRLEASRLLAAKIKISKENSENGAPKRVIRGQNAALTDKR